MFNERKTYAVVDENNKILDTFRVLSTALYMLPKLKLNRGDNSLTIKKLK